MANITDFLINSDYPMDKIVFLEEISIPVSANQDFSRTIAHNLGSTPFCNAVFSLDNWQTTYSNGSQELDDSGQSYTKTLLVLSDGSNVYVKGRVDASGELKVRIWGVFNESDTVNVDAPLTSGRSNNTFFLNSDYNYPKLIREGISDATNGVATINHNMGYVPFCDLWVWHKEWNDPDYRWYPVGYKFYLAWMSGSISGGQEPPEITSSDLILRNGKFYYRIYGDDTTI